MPTGIHLNHHHHHQQQGHTYARLLILISCCCVILKVSALTTAPSPIVRSSSIRQSPLPIGTLGKYSVVRSSMNDRRTTVFQTSNDHLSSTLRTDCRMLLPTFLRRNTLQKRQRQRRRWGKRQNHLDALLSTPSSTSSSEEDNIKSTKPKLTQRLYHRLRTLPPSVQLITLLSAYVFHLTVLTQNALIFPIQLIPNDMGRYQSIGLDSVAGIVSLVSFLVLGRRQRKSEKGGIGGGMDGSSEGKIPTLWEGVSNWDGTGPWKFPRSNKQIKQSKLEKCDDRRTGKEESDGVSKDQKEEEGKRKGWLKPSPKGTSMVALGLLVYAYFLTGRLTGLVELSLYTMSGMGFPLTIAMHRSLVVLGGHLIWVAIGAILLGTLLVPQPFFGGGHRYEDEHASETTTTTTDPTTGTTTITTTTSSPPKQPYRWFTNRWSTNWLWWTIGGYFVSSWLFNVADTLNQIILPPVIFKNAGEGVVAQLINPENNDILASLVGYIAPCISAPWWEEVLYRGFLLPSLSLQMGFWRAVLVSGLVFSVHHVTATGALPLAILGWIWAVIYAKSGNLMVTILIHAMWNSRVFLGSWLGL